jgi:hypothetical protein
VTGRRPSFPDLPLRVGVDFFQPAQISSIGRPNDQTAGIAGSPLNTGLDRNDTFTGSNAPIDGHPGPTETQTESVKCGHYFGSPRAQARREGEPRLLGASI